MSQNHGQKAILHAVAIAAAAFVERLLIELFDYLSGRAETKGKTRANKRKPRRPKSDS